MSITDVQGGLGRLGLSQESTFGRVVAWAEIAVSHIERRSSRSQEKLMSLKALATPRSRAYFATVDDAHCRIYSLVMCVEGRAR